MVKCRGTCHQHHIGNSPASACLVIIAYVPITSLHLPTYKTKCVLLPQSPPRHLLSSGLGPKWPPVCEEGQIEFSFLGLVNVTVEVYVAGDDEVAQVAASRKQFIFGAKSNIELYLWNPENVPNAQ